MFTPNSSSLPYSPTFRIARPPTSCNCGSILKVNELYTIIDDLRSRFITFISQSSNTNITLPQLNMSMGIIHGHRYKPLSCTITNYHKTIPHSVFVPWRHDLDLAIKSSRKMPRHLQNQITPITTPQHRPMSTQNFHAIMTSQHRHPIQITPIITPHHQQMVKHDQTFASTSSYSDHLGNHYPTFSTLVPSYHP